MRTISYAATIVSGQYLEAVMTFTFLTTATPTSTLSVTSLSHITWKDKIKYKNLRRVTPTLVGPQMDITSE